MGRFLCLEPIFRVATFCDVITCKPYAPRPVKGARARHRCDHYAITNFGVPECPPPPPHPVTQILDPPLYWRYPRPTASKPGCWRAGGAPNLFVCVMQSLHPRTCTSAGNELHVHRLERRKLFAWYLQRRLST